MPDNQTRYDHSPGSLPRAAGHVEDIGTASTAPRSPEVFQLDDESPDDVPPYGGASWYVRGQNFCVAYSRLRAEESLVESEIPDEYMVVLPQRGRRIHVRTEDGPVDSIVGPALLIVPAGRSVITVEQDCTLLRVFSNRASHIVSTARNAVTYRHADPAVTPLPARPTDLGPSRTRVYTPEDTPEDPARLGRIFRSDSLMINWFPVQNGPRDPERLSPHVHQDFEQCSVTLEGDYIHHFRSPWTPCLGEWREDQHRTCSSPSIAIIPPGVVHTTRAVGDGAHQLIDIFAPPRVDFQEKGWVLNGGDYSPSSTTDGTIENVL